MSRLWSLILVYCLLRPSTLAGPVNVLSGSASRTTTIPLSTDLKVQEAALKATLPDDTNVSLILLNSTAPSASAHILAHNDDPPGAYGPLSKGPNCYVGRDHPPNPGDCSILTDRICDLHLMLLIPHRACITFSYRSCLAYMCASGCGSGFLTTSTDHWNGWLLATQADCVTREGMLGHYYKMGKPEWKSGLLGSGLIDKWPLPVEGMC